MKTNLTIKNFRVFDENGVSVELNPITILTGCNSSGKSSVVKAVFLLNSFFCQINKDIENGNSVSLGEYKMDFSSYPNNLLGRFDKVVHTGSSCQKVTMEYTLYSLMLSKDVKVQLVFSADKNDELNNAYLESISMSTIDGVFFSSSKESFGIFGKGNKYNFNIIKEDCLDFLQIDYLIHHYCSVYSAYDIDGTVSKEKYEEERNKIILSLHEFDRNRVKDVVNHVYYAKPNFGNIIIAQNADYEVTEWSKENGSLFMIPVLERLASVPKNQIWPLIENEILKKDPDHIFSIASKKVVDGFISSESEGFREYFGSFEKEFLNRQEDRMVHGRLQYRDCPNITPGLRISQEYLLCDPRTSVIGTVVFDGEGDLVKPSEEQTRKNSEEEFENWKERPVDFDMIYEVVMLWNTLAGNNDPENKKYYHLDVGMIGDEYNHTMVQLLRIFVSQLLKELVSPDWCGNMEYVSSSRVFVKRLYSLDVNDDFTQLLKRYYEGVRLSSKGDIVKSWGREQYYINTFINKWVKRFRLGDCISLHLDKEGLGVQIRLHKNPEDEGLLLADEGYGITQLVSILLQIETAILNAEMSRANNWFGISAFQNLIEGYEDNKLREVTIAIEEPEIHLHPAYQSMLADMIVEAYKMFNIHFIIETHSEYLIRKLQVLVAGKGSEEDLQISNDEISILYVNSPKVVEEKGEPQVKKIRVQEDGRLDSPFGTGFFDEADNQAMELLRIKATGK